jgi:CheY-like chemotaxis protein
MGLFLVSLGRTGLDERQRQLVAHIEASSGAAREMLNSLLDFSKLEAGVITPRARAFRLQPLLHKLENEFAPQADARGLVYRTRDTTAMLYGDPTLVELVLRNLIANAIRYSRQGGVLVACRMRRLHAVVEVWDTGIGIPAAQHRDIFREFHQLGNPERDQRKGLGLGLAIVDGLARTMRTRVTLGSRPGRGSVFRVNMPLAWGTPEEAPRPPAPHSLDGLRVLVIDDDAAIRTAMSELLAAWQCECRTAESEEVALALLPSFTPALILADYRLRGHRTGQEALDAIRQRLGRHVPAIIITGDTAADRLRTAHASGTALLHKPVVPQELQAAIDALLRDPATQGEANPDCQATAVAR